MLVIGRVFSELTSPKKPAKVNPEEAKLASLTQRNGTSFVPWSRAAVLRTRRLPHGCSRLSTRSAITLLRFTRSGVWRTGSSYICLSYQAPA